MMARVKYLPDPPHMAFSPEGKLLVAHRPFSNTLGGMRSKGICFHERCPRCLKAADFTYELGRQSLFGKKTIIRIACSSCQTIFQNDDPQEGERLVDIAGITEQIYAATLPLEEGIRQIAAVGSDIHKEICEGSRTWVCDDCGEENFLSVGECWNCQTEHPEMAGLQVDEED